MVFLSHTTCRTCLALSFVFASVCVNSSYAKESSTWKDPKTGLVWQRCSLGQTWNGYDCDGEPESYTWAGAKRAAEAVGKGWRVPAASELVSLARCNTGFQETISVPDSKGGNKTMQSTCNKGASRPAIDTTIFPNTPAERYWTSSPNANEDGYAWCVDITIGYPHDYNKSLFNYVRLVRFGQ